jgi:hypothetical protein
MEKVRQLIYFRNYFWDFFDAQTEKVKDKIDYVLFLISVTERIPTKFFQQISGTEGLYELGLNLKTTFSEFFAVLMKVNWLFFLTDFKRKPKRHPEKRLIRR